MDGVRVDGETARGALIGCDVPGSIVRIRYIPYTPVVRDTQPDIGVFLYIHTCEFILCVCVRARACVCMCVYEV